MNAKPLLNLVILGILLVTILSVPHASAALTSSWQIVAMKGTNVTTQFEAKDPMNISVYPPSSLTSGSIRVLVIWSEKDKQELARYTLGYYPSGSNQSATPKNITVSLAAFPSLIRGDTLLLQIRNAAETIEFTTAISVAVDINALLDQQRNLLIGMINTANGRIDLLQWQLANAIDTENRYLMMFGILLAIVIVYVTRDQWLNKRRKTEEEKSTTEFEQFLEQFVLERYTPGDVKDG